MIPLYIEKLLLIESLVVWRGCGCHKARRIVATNGCFDVLTAGHVHCLQEAKKYGDILVVGVNGDESVRALKGKGRPFNTANDRIVVLAALECVDYVCVFMEKRATEFLRRVRPDVYIKGGDYTLDSLDYSELKALRIAKAKIKFVPLRKCKSTSELLK